MFNNYNMCNNIKVNFNACERKRGIKNMAVVGEFEVPALSPRTKDTK